MRLVYWKTSLKKLVAIDTPNFVDNEIRRKKIKENLDKLHDKKQGQISRTPT